MQLQLNFDDRSRHFSSGTKKVTFAISYLKGSALAHFEPAVLGEIDRQDWQDDYSLFVEELKTNFGPYDVEAEAESELDALSMRYDQRISDYNVKFTRLSVLTGYNDQALRHSYYKGLPDRIKDEISRQGKPKRLVELRTLAISIDARYWERRAEKSRDNPRFQSDNSDKSTRPKQDQSRTKQTVTTTSTMSSPDTSASKPNSSSSKKPDFDKILGPDRKLLPEVRQHRLNNKLCLFCGGVGHQADNCRKKDAAKARASTITETKSQPTPAATESKK
jgi:ribosomal protein L40E